MTHLVLPVPTTVRLRLKTIAKLLLVSVPLVAASPAFATQIARHDVHCRACEQKTDACRYRTFEPCISPETGATHFNGGDRAHDDWPANMILG
jgi:hypothetical protein